MDVIEGHPNQIRAPLRLEGIHRAKGSEELPVGPRAVSDEQLEGLQREGLISGRYREWKVHTFQSRERLAGALERNGGPDARSPITGRCRPPARFSHSSRRYITSVRNTYLV